MAPALSRAKSFNVQARGHKALAAVVLAFCFTAWAVQLAGVSGLQSVCKGDLHLERNNVDTIASALAQAAAITGGINPGQANPTTNAIAIKQIAASILPILRQVSYRSSSVFTLTPDEHCAEYYRYQWLNMGLQFVVLILAIAALFFGLLTQARVAICSLLVVSSMLAIENAHTFFHVRVYAPEDTLKWGKVFFVGCCATCGANLVLLLLLGTHDEQAPSYARNRAYEHSPETTTPTQGSSSQQSTPAKATLQNVV